MAVRFGTDGIRGRVDVEITESLAYRVGVAAGQVFVNSVFVVGADTRESSFRLAQAAMAGLANQGCTIVNLGVVSTPGVAVVAEKLGGAGFVVSASHNPAHDNGFKVFGLGGTKLDEAGEQAISARLESPIEIPTSFSDVPIDLAAVDMYVDKLKNALPNNALGGLSVVLDCANGSASSLAADLFRSFGARVEVLNASPNGTNINLECGSGYPSTLSEAVLRFGADLGLAFDGDADRLIAVDASGFVRDGDDLMILFANDLHERGELGDVLVVTSLSNLGLHRAMQNSHIDVIQTDVGDRWIYKELSERDLPFGGEQSGHLIFHRLWPTGDGMLSGLLLCDLICRRGSLFDLASSAWQRSPQRLINISKDLFDNDVVTTSLNELVTMHQLTTTDYRLLVRPSGTEPVVRVMIEAPDMSFIDEFEQLVLTRTSSSPKRA